MSGESFQREIHQQTVHLWQQYAKDVLRFWHKVSRVLQGLLWKTFWTNLEMACPCCVLPLSCYMCLPFCNVIVQGAECFCEKEYMLPWQRGGACCAHFFFPCFIFFQAMPNLKTGGIFFFPYQGLSCVLELPTVLNLQTLRTPNTGSAATWEEKTSTSLKFNKWNSYSLQWSNFKQSEVMHCLDWFTSHWCIFCVY